MNTDWNNKEQLERFLSLQRKKPEMPVQHTRELWDRWAHNWESGLREDEARKERSRKRITATAEFLRSHGLLGADCEVIDIGCGPGRFVAEFAKTAKHVTGTDLSPNMLDYAAEFCREQGLSNTSFTACDFKKADIRQLGWEKRFDLVFSSITPAVSDYTGVEKAMAMSRGWCFHASFLSRQDDLLRAVSEEVFGRKAASRWDGRSPYALFNILWLRGWHPYVSYYSEKSIDQYTADRALADRLAENLGIDREDEASIVRILDFLQKKADSNGELHFPFRSDYIWLLWNVEEKTDRSSYETMPGN